MHPKSDEQRSFNDRAFEKHLTDLKPDQQAQYQLLRPLIEPILTFLLDPHVGEIFILNEQDIRVRKGATDHRTQAKFPKSDLELLIKQIGTFSHHPIGWNTAAGESPILEGNLPDGSRCSGVLAGVNVDGHSLTIRKQRRQQITAEQLLEWGTLTREQLSTLAEAVRQRRNILISGGTNTGKTTLLNVLSQFIAPDERVLVVEDTPELQLAGHHVVRFRTMPSAGVDFLALLRLCMRQTGDRILFGESRGAEAWPYVLALNSGHPGSMTTIHANNPEAALEKLTDYCLLAKSTHAPRSVFHSQIQQVIDLVVQLNSYPKRHVSKIYWVEPD